MSLQKCHHYLVENLRIQPCMSVHDFILPRNYRVAQKLISSRKEKKNEITLLSTNNH